MSAGEQRHPRRRLFFAQPADLFHFDTTNADCYANVMAMPLFPGSGPVTQNGRSGEAVIVNILSPMAAPSHRPRNRIATRVIMEMQVDGVATLTRAFNGNFDRALIFFALLRESREIRRCATGTVMAEGSRCPGMSVNALAASLARPFETIRRHVNTLIEAGLCIRHGQHVSVAPDATKRHEIAVAVRRLHDIMVRLVEDMASFDLPLPATRAHGAHDAQATIAAAIDMLLTAIEFHGPQHPDWIEVITYGAVMAANARPYSYDPVLANIYSESDTVPPEGLRLPIATAALARALHLPYSTIGRHIVQMIADGRLVRRDGGVMIATNWMQTPSQIAGARIMAERTAQIFARLAAGGFAFDIPGALYLDGRPALVDFGPRHAVTQRLPLIAA